MSSDKELIFISFSKRETEKVANLLKNLINSIYPISERNVEVFFSTEKIKAGGFKGQILEKMKNAKFAISILSPENKSAPWLMYEAGCLSLAVEQNGGHLMPYLFCRHTSERESSINDLQYAEYQRDSKNNQKQLTYLLNNVNNSLSSKNQVRQLTIENKINDEWGEIEKDFDTIAINLYNSGASNVQKGLDSKVNESISINAIEGNFETHEQTHIRLVDDFVPQTPGDIEEKFEKILHTQIPKKLYYANEQDKLYNATRVIAHDTRFSTFIAFTDGKRIILFDRRKDEAHTNVTNDRLDVFGAVQFENRSIKVKIKNEDFFKSKILKTESINGAAIESNRLKTNNEKEVAVMFGACIYLSPRDLELAKHGATKGEITIYHIDTVYEICKNNKDLLTSKATLAISHIIKNNIL